MVLAVLLGEGVNLFYKSGVAGLVSLYVALFSSRTLYYITKDS